MNVKPTETLFVKGNYETPKKLNRSTRTVPQQVVEEIETKGITAERLDQLGLPVYKYKTQITIHGIFNTEGNGRLGGYKSLLQNQNGSLGIKYIAIDYEKKRKVYDAMKGAGFSVSQNSSAWKAYKMNPIKTREEIQPLMIEAKELENRIAPLYIGHVQFYLGQLFGTVYAVTEVTVNSIYEKNVEAFILAATGKTYDEILKERQAERKAWEEKMAAQKAEREAEHRAIKERRAPIKDKIIGQIKDLGYAVEERVPVNGDQVIAIAWDDNDTYRFAHYKFEKKGNQRQLRKYTAYTENLSDKPTWSTFGDKWRDRKVKMFFLQVEKPEQPKVGATHVLSSEISVIEYGKGIAVMGNTYPIKDKLKALGARFNRNLQGGPGWILPASKKSEVLKLQA